MTGSALPRWLVLDDREGLVRSGPGLALLRERCRMTVLDQPLDRLDDAELDDYLARRLDPAELLDPEVVPAEDALGGMHRARPG